MSTSGAGAEPPGPAHSDQVHQGRSPTTLEQDRRRLYQPDPSAADVQRYRKRAAIEPGPEPESERDPGPVVRSPLVPHRPLIVLGVAGIAVLALLLQAQPSRLDPRPTPGGGVRAATAQAFPLPPGLNASAFSSMLARRDAGMQARLFVAVREHFALSGSTDVAIAIFSGSGPSTRALGPIGVTAKGRTMRIVVVTATPRYTVTVAGRRGGHAGGPVARTTSDPERHDGVVGADVAEVAVGFDVRDLSMRIGIAVGEPYLCYVVVTD